MHTIQRTQYISKDWNNRGSDMGYSNQPRNRQEHPINHPAHPVTTLQHSDNHSQHHSIVVVSFAGSCTAFTFFRKCEKSRFVKLFLLLFRFICICFVIFLLLFYPIACTHIHTQYSSTCRPISFLKWQKQADK